ncbi:hypothetical protein EVAR_50570_1 [Eumeta japonica]|uniref:Uncharacterized protein n=1 Tax=Eumeta variegata TaxID=151549 RepID=A0A4C1ZAJ8_EUMVA|nr:hypothetical protein EVAR_50570_1 [Eumeta japonica]
MTVMNRNWRGRLGTIRQDNANLLPDVYIALRKSKLHAIIASAKGRVTRITLSTRRDAGTRLSGSVKSDRRRGAHGRCTRYFWTKTLTGCFCV